MAPYSVQNLLPSTSAGSGVQGHHVTFDASSDLVDQRDALIRHLREAVAARDDFLAVAAHELRGPFDGYTGAN